MEDVDDEVEDVDEVDEVDDEVEDVDDEEELEELPPDDEEELDEALPLEEDELDEALPLDEEEDDDDDVLDELVLLDELDELELVLDELVLLLDVLDVDDEVLDELELLLDPLPVSVAASAAASLPEPPLFVPHATQTMLASARSIPPRRATSRLRRDNERFEDPGIIGGDANDICAASARSVARRALTGVPQPPQDPRGVHPMSDPTAGEAARIPQSRRPMLWRALWRWLAVSLVLAFWLVVYLRHPYYTREQFDGWRTVYRDAFGAWIVFGVPYLALTLRRFSTPEDTLRDGALHLMVLARSLLRRNSLRAPLQRPRLRTTALGILVKAFFTPLMVSFLGRHLLSLAHARAQMPASFRTYDGVQWLGGLYYNGLFAVDCAVASVGYCMESRWLGNKARSVEPTGFGWAVALICYPPFNEGLAAYLPLREGPPIITSHAGLLACRVVVLAAFTVYVWATLAMGLRFSNLSNRGLVERGPYRWVRHPAYAAKCFAWWFEHMPTMTLSTAVFLLGVNGVYGLRAWTEERHLARDPAYRDYQRRVRWTLVPKVF